MSVGLIGYFSPFTEGLVAAALGWEHNLTMSMFKKLRGTLQNAQQDFVEGLRALATLDSQPRLEVLRHVKTRDINLDVGGELLQSYQKVWSDIQTDTKESAKTAEEVSTLLVPLFKVWDRHAEAIAQLEEEVKTIPNILSTLGQLHTLLDGLRQDFIVAEKGMDMLENLCQELELKNGMLEEQRKLAVYKLRKDAEADKIKVELAQSHAKKMAQLESSRVANLQERAEAFTSAFQEDLNYYRTHGHPDRLPTEFPKVSSLSEIEIDEDKQALDSFLGPDPEGDAVSDAAEDGAYFEDDYTADFSVKQDAEFPDDVDYIASNVIAHLEMDDVNYIKDSTRTVFTTEEVEHSGEVLDTTESKHLEDQGVKESMSAASEKADTDTSSGENKEDKQRVTEDIGCDEDEKTKDEESTEKDSAISKNSGTDEAEPETSGS